MRCDFSHMNYDDPIVNPGIENSMHLHAYFGNTGTNFLTSTPELLDGSSVSSTCMGGPLNKTAYWVPSVVYPVYQREGVSGSNAGFILQNDKPIHVTDNQGDAVYAVVKPQGYFEENGQFSDHNSALFYYKSAHLNEVNSVHIPTETVPDGLRMIHGNPFNTTAAGTEAGWECLGTAGVFSHIPECNGVVELTIHFPECWDGINLDSADHKSHMAQAANGRTCPGELTADPTDDWVRIPRISYLIRYPVTEGNATPQIDPSNGTVVRNMEGNVILDSSNWFLSSDRYTAYGKMQDAEHATPTDDARPGDYSAHADWLMAWEPEVLNDFVQHCIVEERDCSNGELGNGYRLLFDSIVTDPSKNPTLDPTKNSADVITEGHGNW